ncbi:copper oxidase [Humibacter ginsenosidimutans]|uniref:Copper-containing nitrite reductase n=1 Tax=Humibacter ginsenosidimutans TaxID=2599293 RepID=A0A5B8M7S6_9MICO|nr:copper oxidase [Humibacter ginsenosidimutans]
MSRRAWYAVINGVVVAWMLAAGIALLAQTLEQSPSWLAVHLLLLGGATSAILIWSQHFADTILRKAGSRTRLGVRLALHTIGALAVVVGVTTGLWMLVLAGGTLVAATAAWHGTTLGVRLRRALPSRFGGLVLYYVAASLTLIIGVTLGVIMARADLTGTEHDRMFVAHVTMNVLGWIGLTVVGTVVLLWPTVLHARIGEQTRRRARIALVALCVGLLVVGMACLTGVWVAILLGTVVYLAGLAVIGIDLVGQAVRTPPVNYAGWSMGAALAWFAATIVAFGVRVATAGSWQGVASGFVALLVPFGIGFAAQLVMAALSYLLPVVFGGGPVKVRATNVELDRFGLFRVVVVNGAVLLAVIPGVPNAGVFLGVAVVVLLSTVVQSVRALIVARSLQEPTGGDRHVRREGAARPTMAGMLHVNSGAAMAAIGVLVLAASVGVAVANVSGSGGAASSSSAATGRTTSVHMVMKNMRFSPSTIDVPAGNRLVIHVTNEDDMVHDLTLADGITSGRLVEGESATVDAGVITRTVDGWCSIVGHRQLGMVFTVVATGATASHEASDGMQGMPDMTQTPQAGATSAAADIDWARMPAAGFTARDPLLKPAASGTVHDVTLTVRDTVTEVAPGVEQTLWTYNGTAPGPTLHGEVGDTFRVTLVNAGDMGHSIDFHAGSLSPNQPMRTIEPGQRLTYTFTATRAGIWLYHCSTMPMAAHIANGMFGAVVIDPPGLDPVAEQFVFVQSEYYLGPQKGVVDTAKLAAENPDLVVFNGYANQYVYRPIEVKAGQRVRIWVLDAGPNKASSFHVVGGQFDTVFKEGDYLLKNGGSTGVGGSQALDLQPAQGGFVELTFPAAGDYSFVTHIMSDAEKGATGTFHVTASAG